MSYKTLMFDANQNVVEDGEKAFRRIAAEKLRARGCSENEVKDRVARLLSKPMTKWQPMFAKAK